MSLSIKNWFLGLDFGYIFKKLGTIAQVVTDEKMRKRKPHPSWVLPQLQTLMWISTDVDIFTFYGSFDFTIWVCKISKRFCQWKVNLLRARIQLIRHKLHEIEKDAKWRQEGTMTKDIYAKCVINVLDMCSSGLSWELKVLKSVFWLYVI